MGIYRWSKDNRKIKGTDWNSLADLVELLQVPSNPPTGCYKVTNLYVEMVDGNPKLRVEYEI